MVASVWGDGTPNEAFEIPPADIVIESAISYAILVADAQKVHDYIGTGGHTFTLPDAATAGNGWYVVIRNKGSGTLTIARTGTNTVEGAASFVLSPNQAVGLLVKATDFGIVYSRAVGSTAAGTSSTPAGNLSATDVQAALAELDAEKALLAGSAAQTFAVAAPSAGSHAVNKTYGAT